MPQRAGGERTGKRRWRARVTWDLETDVIVVGFGAAGACAALEAAAPGYG